MAPLRTRLAKGVLQPGELHAEWLPYRHRHDGQATGVVVGLSHGASVAGYFNPPYDKEVRALADRGMVVVVPGASGSSWGNVDSVEAIQRGVDHLRSALGCARKVGLVGFSMGALSVCGWARCHIDEVSRIALVTPVLDFGLLYESGPYTDEIQRAHGGDAGVRRARPTLDPTCFASQLRPIRIGIWYSSDDPIVPAQAVHRFAERHGGEVDLNDLGAVGHDPTAAPAAALAAFVEGS